MLTLMVGTLTFDLPAQRRDRKTTGQHKEQPVKKNRASDSKKRQPARTSSGAGAKVTKKGKAAPKKGVAPRNESRSELEKRQRDTQAEIAATRKRIQENEKEVSRNVKELGRLQSEIAVIKGEVASSSKRVAILGAEISRLESKIASEEKELTRLRAEYLKAVKSMRGRRKGNSDLAYLFSSNSLGEARRRFRYLREFSDWRKNRSSQIESGVKELEKQKQDLARDKAMQDKALASQMASQRQLEARHKEKDVLVVELKKNGAALQSHLAKKQSEANTLNSRVAALIAAEQRAEEARRLEAERKAAEQRERDMAARSRQDDNKTGAETPEVKGSQGKGKSDKKDVKKTGSENGGGNDYATARRRRPRSDKEDNSKGGSAPSAAGKPVGGATGFASMRGSLPRPVAGAFNITSPFGRHSLPDLPDVMYDNPGIDAQVAPGSSALAVYAGKVSGVYMIPGFSTVVIVNHGEYYTVYGNLATAGVKVGDVVKQGHALGSVAADEDDPSRGMIHFEVWKNREKLNPQSWIR